MLPQVVPSANIFTFTWNSDYYTNAPVVRIEDVADMLLSKLKSQRDEVEPIHLWVNSLIFGIGTNIPKTAHFHSFVLWGTHRHQGQVESSVETKKADD